MCGRRKYPDPTAEEIGNYSRGVGQGTRKFQRGGGLDNQITFQGVNINSFSTRVRTLLLIEIVVDHS